MKKIFILALLLMCSQSLFSCEDGCNKSNNSWGSYLSPYIMTIIVQVGLKPLFCVIEAGQTYVYEQYWLTEEQRKERAEEKKIMLEQVRQQALLMKDPRWKEATIQLQQQEVRRGEQNLTIGKHQLQENKLILRASEREEDEKEAQFLQELIKNSSQEKRTELQKKYDDFVVHCVEQRMKKN